jgi:multidrug efflux pump subunit AcrA (membrane-fusion protein)
LSASSNTEQRRVQPGQTTGEMRVIESGLKPDERVVVAGILDAVPGQKVNSQLQVPKSTTAEPAGSQ